METLELPPPILFKPALCANFGNVKAAMRCQMNVERHGEYVVVGDYCRVERNMYGQVELEVMIFPLSAQFNSTYNTYFPTQA